MIRRPIDPSTRIVLGILSCCVLVAGYFTLSWRQKRINPNDRTIPSASQFVEGVRLLTKDRAAESSAIRFLGVPVAYADSWIVEDATASLGRLALGMSLGCVLAFFVGVAMGCFAQVEAVLMPPISFLAKIPPTAMVVLYMVIFGLGMQLFVALIAIGIFPILAQAIYQAVKKDVSEHAIYKAYTLGASRFEAIWEVVVPQTLPRIIEAIRLQVGPALIFLVAAELLYADAGFGFRLKLQARQFNYNVIFIYLFLLGMLGMCLDWALAAFRRWWCPWFGE